MAKKIRIFVSPGNSGKPADSKWDGAFFCYKISAEGNLQRAKGAEALAKGGLMGIIGGIFAFSPQNLKAQIAVECAKQGFAGVVFSADTIADEEAFMHLCRLLISGGIEVFVYPKAAHLTKEGRVIVSSAVGGGAFADMLNEAARAYPARPLCLEINRMCHDFAMPSFQSEGKRLSKAELEGIITKHRPSPYYNPDLMCRYFTYTEGAEGHFVLFDDPETAIAKIKAASSCGFTAAIIHYSQWGSGTKSIVDEI